MTDIFEIPDSYNEKAWVNDDQYREMYRESIENPEKFWSEQAERISWFKKWDTVLDWDYHEAHIRWYEGGKLNVSYNCLDRHLKKRGDQIALIWEGDDPPEDRSYTYSQLHEQVCRFANVLKNHGIEKGDRVMIYMPMVPELPIAMLACARLGVTHSVVFGGFSSEALKARILDLDARVVITADGG